MGNNQSQSSTPRKESPTAPTNDSTLPSTIVVDLDKRLLQSLEDSTPCPLSIPSPPLPPRNSPFSQYAVSPDPRELLDDLPSEPSSRPGHRRSASFDNLTYNSQKKSAPEPPVVVAATSFSTLRLGSSLLPGGDPMMAPAIHPNKKRRNRRRGSVGKVELTSPRVPRDMSLPAASQPRPAMGTKELSDLKKRLESSSPGETPLTIRRFPFRYRMLESVKRRRAHRLTIHLNKESTDLLTLQMEGSPDLTELSLSGDDVKHLPPLYALVTESLRSVTFDLPSLHRFPSGLFEAEFIESLVIRSDKLKQIPSAITRLRRLEMLEVVSGKKISIPRQLFGLPRLTTLKVASPKMKSIPSNINEAHKTLTSLNLSLPNANLPLEVFELTNLVELKLDSFGSLTEIPAELFSLTSLEVLHLSHSPSLTRVPHLGWRRMIALSELSLEGCGISDLPAQMYHLVCLSTLNISHNRFSILPPVLSALPSLENLDIQFNVLSFEYNDSEFTGIPMQAVDPLSKKLNEFSFGNNPWLDPPSEEDVSLGIRTILCRLARGRR